LRPGRPQRLAGCGRTCSADSRIALFPRLAREVPNVGVEAPQVPVVLLQQALKAWHAVVVSRNRGEIGVVEPLIEPVLIGHGTPRARGELRHIGGQRREERPLSRAHHRYRDARCVEFFELGSAAPEQADILELAGVLPLVPLQIGRTSLREQPASDAFVLDGDGERFVEGGISGHVEQLMRQLVEDDPGELDVAVREHRVEHRIGEPAER
jgi:hypothetical protein